jgi:pimeloyl-ACP methyl ester carboxylesterase
VSQALDLPALLHETGSLQVGGCPIRWYAGGTGGPPLVLVHGGGAHAGWWEPVLSALLARQRVVALDLSGHGDSGRRLHGYSTATWADEVAAVLREVAGGPAAVIGHSLGGRVGTMTAGRYPESVSALVTLDAVVPPQESERYPRVGPPKLYDNLEQILAAFHLMPPQPQPGCDVLHRLACRSVTPLQDGRYTWKFDPQSFGALHDTLVTADIPKVRCPVTIVLGGRSSVTTPAVAAAFQTLLGRAATVITFPRSHHHIPLDDPAELVDLLARLAGTRPLAASA